LFGSMKRNIECSLKHVAPAFHLLAICPLWTNLSFCYVSVYVLTTIFILMREKRIELKHVYI
jgi:hypothetical protein